MTRKLLMLAACMVMTSWGLGCQSWNGCRSSWGCEIRWYKPALLEVPPQPVVVSSSTGSTSMTGMHSSGGPVSQGNVQAGPAGHPVPPPPAPQPMPVGPKQPAGAIMVPCMPMVPRPQPNACNTPCAAEEPSKLPGTE